MTRRYNSKPLTDQERDARRKADRERIERAARDLLTSGGWQRWIRVRATNGLSRYSVTSLCLISAACYARGITPTYVAGFRAFLDLNRVVRKGEQAIKILAPVTVKDRDEHGDETGEKRLFFRTVNVWDVSMTDVLPGRDPVPIAPPSQPITGDSHYHLIPTLIAHAKALGYTVEIRDLPENGPGGWCDPQRHEIVVASGPANRQVCHAGARDRSRARPGLRRMGSRALRGTRGLRDRLRARLGRARRQRRVDPLHRRLGRRRRARRDPRIRRHDRHDRAPHRRGPRAQARAGCQHRRVGTARCIAMRSAGAATPR
jgi:hypothetical protein